MARKTNIFHLFNSKMTKSISIAVVVLALWFSNVSLYAQNNMVISYDEETEVLTIDNQGGVVQLVKTDDMPLSIQKAMAEMTVNNKIGHGLLTIDGVGKDEMRNYKEVVFYSRDGNGNYTVKNTASIQIHEKVKRDETEEPVMENTHHTRKYLPFVIAGISVAVLLLIILMARLIYSRKKRKKLEEERKSSSQVMQVVEEEESDCSVGLNHVYQDSDNYYMVDMHVFFKDTAVEKVFLSRNIIKRVNSYFKEFLDKPDRTPETGCYLIGAWERVTGTQDRYNVSIEEMVTPGDDMIPGEFSLNFGLKIGIELGSTIRNLCEKTLRDYVQTAWMHSHPGLGLFLSSHDLVVQKQLTYPDEPKRLLAIVIDTNTPDWKTVIFSAKNNGTMNNKEELLQTISFDTLLEWSRHKTTSASSIPIDINNTFHISSENATDLFAFSSKAINQMDDLIGVDSSDEVYAFHSEIQQIGNRKIRLISDCSTMETGHNNCFVGKELDDSTAFMAHYAELLQRYDFGIVYRDEQQSCILYRNAREEICTLPVSLKEMKEWTRRKRV